MDNQRLAATVVVLKHDFAISQQKMCQLSTVAAAVKVERDEEIWRVYDTSLKMDDKIAIECEKKNSEINNEHCEVMEKNTIALQLVREIEDFVQNGSPKQGKGWFTQEELYILALMAYIRFKVSMDLCHRHLMSYKR
ncbi:hypothetical protein ACFE04_002841 [Oxalis oulophora]